jgi:U3 small nucleolar RNA-associated protein 14
MAVQNIPLREQLRLKREGTYRSTQQEMDKWVGIVKLNREKETLNLVPKDRDNAANITSFPTKPISQLQSKIEGQLKQMDIQGQQAVLKKEEQALAQVSKEEAQERLKQARKQRTLQFNEEVKRRRIAKIKSKLYHKIKKRQKMRDEAKRVS